MLMDLNDLNDTLEETVGIWMHLDACLLPSTPPGATSRKSQNFNQATTVGGREHQIGPWTKTELPHGGILKRGQQVKTRQPDDQAETDFSTEENH